jgi:hypothetical protein
VGDFNCMGVTTNAHVDDGTANNMLKRFN